MHLFWVMFCLFLQWPTLTCSHSYRNATMLTTDYHIQRIQSYRRVHTLHLLATKGIETEFSQKKQKSTRGTTSNEIASIQQKKQSTQWKGNLTNGRKYQHAMYLIWVNIQMYIKSSYNSITKERTIQFKNDREIE